MTVLLPVAGVGARISGSTPAGGHTAPLDLASLSPSGSLVWPVVWPSGAIVPRGGTGCIGAQLVVRAGGGGAVWAGGADGVGGACALTAPQAAISTHERRSECFILMPGKRSARAEVPRKKPHRLAPRAGRGRRRTRFRGNFRICGSGSAKNAPSAASVGARRG